ncbi:MAG TPA: HAD family hydrolase [Acidimicrobiales bacterium]|nr:HAD family hydrolase [Acidimicrobiales bacterium]
MLQPPGLVIFDCDGVLIDTERLAVPIDVEILGRLGWQITEAEVVERFLGRSEADCTREIEAHLGRPLPAAVSFEVDQRYREAFERELEPVRGVLDVLDALQGGHVPACVASSGTIEKMRFTLALTGLFDRFEGRIFSIDDVTRGKPAPDLFLHAASSMGVDPELCAVVEDSPYGLEAALVAGMQAYAYAGGLTPLHRLQVPGAVVFHRMDELPALFGL